MSDYIAIDKAALNDQLQRIAAAAKDTNIDDDQLSEMDDAMSQINALMHSIDKPIQIEDRRGSFAVTINKEP